MADINDISDRITLSFSEEDKPLVARFWDKRKYKTLPRFVTAVLMEKLKGADELNAKSLDTLPDMNYNIQSTLHSMNEIIAQLANNVMMVGTQMKNMATYQNILEGRVGEQAQTSLGPVLSGIDDIKSGVDSANSAVSSYKETMEQMVSAMNAMSQAIHGLNKGGH